MHNNPNISLKKGDQPILLLEYLGVGEAGEAGEAWEANTFYSYLPAGSCRGVDIWMHQMYLIYNKAFNRIISYLLHYRP